MPVSRDARPGLAALFADISDSCGRLGAPTYADLAAHVAETVGSTGPLSELLAPYASAAVGDMVPLRLMAAVHRLVLERQAPGLAVFYATVGGTPPVSERARRACRLAFDDVVDAHAPRIAQHLASVPQTNEVGRTEGLAALLRKVGADFGHPVRLHEIGTSAGLSLRVRELVSAGVVADSGQGWGPWPDVSERVGVDRAPVDITTTDGRLHLTSFIWSDHVDRFERLRQALDVADRVPADIQCADAADHVASLTLSEGSTLVLWHSAMWMYLSPAKRASINEILDRLGAKATPQHPLVHIWLEPDDHVNRHRFRLQMVSWPGRGGIPAGVPVLWGTAPPAGTPVQWAVPCAGSIARDGRGRILLVRRGREPARGTWSLPGGRLEAGESWSAGAQRELREETGLTGEIVDFAGIVEREGPGDCTYVIADFHVRAEGHPLAADDADDARWVGRAELDSLVTSPGLLEALGDWSALPD